ncbi:tRNA dimethylallyltransferase [Alicyclobacillus sacchari]|uniref:tRNA (adenosine(37)-N6)-dimethylallyltransferase MiaA n=1 Tax=Alicyclobacillus sacchari TaxID=392010 RepID=UPI0023E94AD8|nr:tRNA (adenosine(37)-N6)-dimethylallyltransferase MiaA [Alicyclobacillus sacchari]GMA59122.1 tRNA dimethylallyltransferase [Alicyclobacillus sacchari]
MKSISIVCIVGPTAIGKSELAVVVAKRYGGEVVSADSMQVYRGMDIGTAKLTKEEMEGVEHHLIDVVDPADTYTAARWKHAADAVIVDIAGRGHLPVVCGGTGLYIRALTDDLDFIKAPETAESRTHWQRYLAEHGAFALYEALRERDPERAQQLHPNDVKRVIRALEVADAAAAPMSARYDWSVRSGRYHTLIIGLTMEREALYRRVDQRVLQMWKALPSEVRRMLAAGVLPHATSLQAIGYKEVVAMLAGEVGEEETIATIQRNTRRFVKRQLSWFRRDPRVVWFEKTASGDFASGEEARLWNTIDEFLKENSQSPPNT